MLSVQATYDIVDVYEKADDDSTSYPDYTSGYARALVTSPSDTSDEGLRDGSGTDCTCAAVSGPTGGSLSVSIDAGAQGGSATFKQATFKSTGAYGVLLRARDNDGNLTTKGAVSVKNEDVTLDSVIAANASFTHKLANWPPVDTDFDGNVKDDITASVAGEDDDRAATEIDWATGMVTIAGGMSIPLNTAVTVNYSHAAEGHIVQVDITKPTLTSTPEDGSTTDYAGTVVQFHWSDDEYAGDTNKTVTLNSAMHKGPDGESVDITDSAMLSTTDNKTWGLCLGRRPGARQARVHALRYRRRRQRGQEPEGHHHGRRAQAGNGEPAPRLEPHLVPRRPGQPGRQRHLQRRECGHSEPVRRHEGLQVDRLVSPLRRRRSVVRACGPHDHRPDAGPVRQEQQRPEPEGRHPRRVQGGPERRPAVHRSDTGLEPGSGHHHRPRR